MSKLGDHIVELFLLVLVAVVIYLKLSGVITLSWFWLLCPIWGTFALGLILSIVFLVLYFIMLFVDKEKKNERY